MTYEIKGAGRTPRSDVNEAKNFMMPEQCAEQFEMYAESHPSPDSQHSLRFCAKFLREFCVLQNPKLGHEHNGPWQLVNKSFPEGDHRHVVMESYNFDEVENRLIELHRSGDVVPTSVKPTPIPDRDAEGNYIEPKNCVELVVFDNDGPEGCYYRYRFPRSGDALRFLIEEFGMKPFEDHDLNFHLTNHW